MLSADVYAEQAVRLTLRRRNQVKSGLIAAIATVPVGKAAV